MKTIGYQDFLPKQLDQTKWLGMTVETKYETLAEAVTAASDWATAHQVRVINLETVVLPSLHSSMNQGSADAELTTMDGMGYWYQFVRLWYEYEA